MRDWLAPAALAAAWLGCAIAGWPSRRAIPTPLELLSTARVELLGGELWMDIAATLGRVAGGLALALPVGVVVGIALGHRRARWRATQPTLELVRAVPPVLTFPMFLLALGYGEWARVGAVAFATVGVVILQVGTALERAPQERAEAVALAGVRGLDAVRSLWWFEALPGIFTALRLAFAAALVVAVVTEMLVGSEHGLGARALAAQLGYRADLLWLVIFAAGGLGRVVAGGIAALERRCLPWLAP